MNKIKLEVTKFIKENYFMFFLIFIVVMFIFALQHDIQQRKVNYTTEEQECSDIYSTQAIQVVPARCVKYFLVQKGN